jgi:hypothetical protein
MTLKSRFFLLAFACFSAIFASSLNAQEPAAGGERDLAEAPEASETATMIEQLQLSMALARDGQFGPIKSRDMETLEKAYAFIVETLGQVESVSQLNPQQSQSLELAQSQFDGILRVEEDDRKICKRVSTTGTRLGALECLTVAERRARAEAARVNVQALQRGQCNPSENRPCL